MKFFLDGHIPGKGQIQLTSAPNLKNNDNDLLFQFELNTK
jgi:hypothetical protein